MDAYINQPENMEPEKVEDAAVEYRTKVSPFADSPYVSAYQPEAQAAPVIKVKKKKTHGCGQRRWVAVVLVVALVIVSCGVTAALINGYWKNQISLLREAMNEKVDVLQEQLDAWSGSTQSGTSTVVPDGMMTPAQVYSQNVKAVVAISNQSTTNIFGQISETASSGSGFIISADGYVVTNYHVAENADVLTVLTYDGEEYDAEVIGHDSTNDIALLKIEAEDLPYVTIGSSDALIVGDQVAAIGNPLGELTSTLTVGYVSAKDRIVATDGSTINMIQTDAAINSGNSGGPLFNMKGEVVGITTAKYSGTSSSGATIEGIGFAIPMDDVVGMLEDLREYGYVTGAYLGVWVKDVEATAQAYGIPAGAFVEDVMDGYAAQRCGIQAKDIIIEVGGYQVDSVNGLTRSLRKFEAGDTTTVTVYRSGKEVILSITFDEKPQETPQAGNDDTLVIPDNGGSGNWYDFLDPFFE